MPKTKQAALYEGTHELVAEIIAKRKSEHKAAVIPSVVHEAVIALHKKEIKNVQSKSNG